MATRQQIIDEAKRIRKEISQIFIDVNHWNTSVRKASEQEIDPDPDGKLKDIAAGIDAMLDNENRIHSAKYLKLDCVATDACKATTEITETTQ